MKLKRFLVLVFIFVIVGCAPVKQPETHTRDIPTFNIDYIYKTGTDYRSGVDGYNITRFVDTEASVVCYMFHYGLSCLPLSDTNLEY